MVWVEDFGGYKYFVGKEFSSGAWPAASGETVANGGSRGGKGWMWWPQSKRTSMHQCSVHSEPEKATQSVVGYREKRVVRGRPTSEWWWWRRGRRDGRWREEGRAFTWPWAGRLGVDYRLKSELMLRRV